MIQEKDFLYRVPVKTEPITTPGGQIRNPEILIDLEGGEFMHGNILDANSTNKLINQSVKDAVDNKFIESGLQAAIATKADAAALSNYVLTTALNQQVDTLNAAISAKQDAGNYIPYDDQYKQVYIPDRTLRTRGNNIEAYSNGSGNDRSILQPGNIIVEKTDGNRTHTAKLNIEGLTIRNAYKDIYIDKDGFRIFDADGKYICSFTTTGIRFADKTAKDIPTADGTFINVNDFASADDVSSLRAGLSRKQDKITVNEVDTTDIETADITKLRTIVTNLINALSASDLIRETKTLE